MKTAVIYARVSTEEQSPNTSLVGQLDACREHAARLGYIITKEVQEEFSGTRLDRPGLSEIRLMAQAGELSAVIVYEVGSAQSKPRSSAALARGTRRARCRLAICELRR